ncbi:hypothetical protein BGX27_008146 [Mortierella sp. AM989]|nr:hypothetical protein BGX27_008146 [Mortierella sp. AM989]
MPSTPTVVEQPPPPPLTRGNSVVSLYQSCLNLLERLSGVPDFDEYLEYLNSDMLQNTQAGTPLGTSPNDPVNQLWVLFRLGSPLACIFNGLRPKQPLKINSTDTSLSNINASKAAVFRFLVACRSELQFGENDLFTITELYQDDTNGFVKVIKAVSMVLDRMEEQGLLRARRTTKRNSDAKPTDNRAKVVNEILETERSFVQDLENLQAYMRALQSDGTVISPETIHLIFANLNSLVDFQRRFLITVETNAAFAAQDQNFGQVFLQHEASFAVYEPFCANFAEASKLILSEAPKLQKMAHLMEPIHGITSQLIKPIQRICKYPLFMHELIKLTDPEHPHYRDLVQGQASIKRVADRINETNRKQDNHLIAQALQYKVAWKDGELVSDFGALLLHDKLPNPRSSSDKELEVYLFEKILVCCQEIVNKKKQTKPLARGAKPKPTLHLNGRIYINNIKSILPVVISGSYALHVVWNVAAEEFELRCRNEDQLKKWINVLDKLVTESNAQKSNIVSTTNFIGVPPVNTEQSSFYRDDDEYDDDQEGDEEDGSDEPRGYRSNSLPFGLAGQPAMLGSRPRAKTEDGTVPPVGTWNSRVSGYTAHASANGRSPGMSLPPLPRTTSSGTAMGVMSPGEYPYSPPSSYPASPTVSNSRGSTSSNSSWQRRSNGEGHSPMSETMSKFMSHDGSDDYTPGQPLARNASTGYSYNATPAAPPPVPPIPGQLRVRAQSSPNIHAAANPSWHNAPEMPTPLAHHRRPSNSSGPNSPTTPYPGSSFNIPAVPTIPSRHSSPRPDPSRTLRQQPSNSNLSAGVPQLKIKVNFLEDAYLIVVPIQIGYNDLVERVEKKIRLCQGRRPDTQPLRLRYKDEDNDYIIMKDDDDISLAFESCYAEGVMNLHVS